MKSPYNVNSMTQAVGCVLLKHPDYLQQCIEKICSSREDLYEKLKKLEENKQEIEKVYATSTNFVYLKVQNAEKIFKKLQEQGISIRYMNGYLRVTAGSPGKSGGCFGTGRVVSLKEVFPMRMGQIERIQKKLRLCFPGI